MRRVILAATAVLAASAATAAQAPADIVVARTSHPPVIDGVLDDDTWAGITPLPADGWASYNPTSGDGMPAAYRTEVRVTYDNRNIYFAFHCFDDEPAKIRTTVSKRDAAFSDDWIAISLDSAGTGQSAYHLFTNPSASQMDALNTSASGEQFDADMIWFSGAKTTSDGYTVEVQLPLQTLRFAGADQVRMGLVFFRKVSRIGYSYAWPPMLPGQWVFDRPAHLLFSDLQPRRLVELLPSVTYARDQQRHSAAAWERADDAFNLGVSGKVGLTSAITLDGTINPDFSQVESDAFQVQVNQRFPVFFSEKRPFFMEGMGLFNLAGTGGDSNMRTAVHTRRIVDPIYGSKITGTLGRTAFGVLNAVDDSPTPPFTADGAPIDVPNRVTTVARATYALRRADYVGGIVSHTLQNGRHNLVVGADLSVRPSNAQQITATVLTSDSGGGNTAGGSGQAAQAEYIYATRRVFVQTQGEHYDEHFAMDTAFYNRSGFSGVWSFGEVNFYPKSAWLQRVHPFYFVKYDHDRVQDGDEDFVHSGLRFNVTRQGFLNVSSGRGHEAWLGHRYRVGSDVNLFGNMQTLRWLNLSASYRHGPAIFYDPLSPFQGRSRNVTLETTIQPNQHLSQNIEFDRIRFWKPGAATDVYDVTIVNAKTTYQFNTHFLTRVLAQYDSSVRRVLTDLLASYELVPGTVLHAGYGAIYERRLDSAGAFVPPDDGRRYLAVNRGLFLKASYAHRF